MDVLILTATRHDSTEEVGQAIAERLTADGIDAVHRPAQNRELPAGVPVILGSAIYFGRWLPQAREFAAVLGAETSRRPLWLFSVGPLGDPPQPENPKLSEDLALVLARARSHRVFRGRLDRARLSLRERMMVRMVGAPEGDFREWEQIGEWAGEISTALAPSIH